MSEIIKDTEIDITQDGAHDKFAHYVDRDDMMEAFVYGTPIMALCGKIWVPSREGSGYKTCPTCEEIHSQLS
jgi:hypothetical protein